MLSGDDQTLAKMSGASADELAAALRWQWDMGVDMAVGDAPRNYFAEAAAKAAQPPAPAAAPEADAPAQAVAPKARIAPRLSPEPLPGPANWPRAPQPSTRSSPRWKASTAAR
jgi:hypothetical protein